MFVSTRGYGKFIIQNTSSASLLNQFNKAELLRAIGAGSTQFPKSVLIERIIQFGVQDEPDTSPLLESWDLAVRTTTPSPPVTGARFHPDVAKSETSLQQTYLSVAESPISSLLADVQFLLRAGRRSFYAGLSPPLARRVADLLHFGVDAMPRLRMGAPMPHVVDMVVGATKTVAVAVEAAWEAVEKTDENALRRLGGSWLADELPDELIVYVFSFLDDGDDYRAAASTCSRFWRIAHDHILLRKMITRFRKANARPPQKQAAAGHAPSSLATVRNQYVRVYSWPPIPEDVVDRFITFCAGNNLFSSVLYSKPPPLTRIGVYMAVSVAIYAPTCEKERLLAKVPIATQRFFQDKVLGRSLDFRADTRASCLAPALEEMLALAEEVEGREKTLLEILGKSGKVEDAFPLVMGSQWERETLEEYLWQQEFMAHPHFQNPVYMGEYLVAWEVRMEALSQVTYTDAEARVFLGGKKKMDAYVSLRASRDKSRETTRELVETVARLNKQLEETRERVKDLVKACPDLGYLSILSASKLVVRKGSVVLEDAKLYLAGKVKPRKAPKMTIPTHLVPALRGLHPREQRRALVYYGYNPDGSSGRRKTKKQSGAPPGYIPPRPEPAYLLPLWLLKQVKAVFVGKRTKIKPTTLGFLARVALHGDRKSVEEEIETQAVAARTVVRERREAVRFARLDQSKDVVLKADKYGISMDSLNEVMKQVSSSEAQEESVLAAMDEELVWLAHVVAEREHRQSIWEQAGAVVRKAEKYGAPLDGARALLNAPYVDSENEAEVVKDLVAELQRVAGWAKKMKRRVVIMDSASGLLETAEKEYGLSLDGVVRVMATKVTDTDEAEEAKVLASLKEELTRIKQVVGMMKVRLRLLDYQSATLTKAEEYGLDMSGVEAMIAVDPETPEKEVGVLEQLVKELDIVTKRVKMMDTRQSVMDAARDTLSALGKMEEGREMAGRLHQLLRFPLEGDVDDPNADGLVLQEMEQEASWLKLYVKSMHEREAKALPTVQVMLHAGMPKKGVRFLDALMAEPVVDEGTEVGVMARILKETDRLMRAKRALRATWKKTSKIPKACNMYGMDRLWAWVVAGKDPMDGVVRTLLVAMDVKSALQRAKQVASLPVVGWDTVLAWLHQQGWGQMSGGSAQFELQSLLTVLKTMRKGGSRVERVREMVTRVLGEVKAGVWRGGVWREWAEQVTASPTRSTTTVQSGTRRILPPVDVSDFTVVEDVVEDVVEGKGVSPPTVVVSPTGVSPPTVVSPIIHSHTVPQ